MNVVVDASETYFNCPVHNGEFMICKPTGCNCYCCRYDDDGIPIPGVPDECPLLNGCVVLSLNGCKVEELL